MIHRLPTTTGAGTAHQLRTRDDRRDRIDSASWRMRMKTSKKNNGDTNYRLPTRFWRDHTVCASFGAILESVVSLIHLLLLLLLSHISIPRLWVLCPHVHRVWYKQRAQVGVGARAQVKRSKVEIHVEIRLEACEIRHGRGNSRVPVWLQ